MKTALLTASALALSALTLALRPAPAGAPATPAAGATSYTVDGGHSSVIYKVTHMGVSNFYGAFKALRGEVAYDPKDPTASQVRIEIDAQSVDSRDERRDNHLRSPDFLNAAEFPTIVFQSAKVTKGKGDALEVRGVLELRGVEREVTATVVKTGEGEGQRGKLIGFEARFTIDAKAFDLAYTKKMAGALGTDIEVVVALECSAG